MVDLQKMYIKISRQSWTRRKYLRNTNLWEDMYPEYIRNSNSSVLEVTD